MIMHKPIRVFRHEDEANKGPYYSASKNGEALMLSFILNQAHRDDEHPTVSYEMDELRGKTYEQFLCSMSSLDGLRKWFSGFHAVLRETGHVAKEYKVTEWAKASNGQILFNPSSATLVRCHTISG